MSHFFLNIFAHHHPIVPQLGRMNVNSALPPREILTAEQSPLLGFIKVLHSEWLELAYEQLMILTPGIFSNAVSSYKAAPTLIMASLAPVFKKAYWAVFFGATFYVCTLVALTNPWLQRQ